MILLLPGGKSTRIVSTVANQNVESTVSLPLKAIGIKYFVEGGTARRCLLHNEIVSNVKVDCNVKQGGGRKEEGGGRREKGGGRR